MPTPTIQEIRAKYPQYSDLSDEELLTKFHARYYSDMPLDSFRTKVGITPQQVPPPAAPPEAPESEGPKGWADWRQLPARLGQGVTEIGAAFEGGAAKIDRLLGQDPTRSLKRQAALRGRAQLLEDVVPPGEGFFGGLMSTTAQQIPSLLLGEQMFAANAPRAALKALEVTKGMKVGSKVARRFGRGAGSGLGYAVASGEAIEKPSTLLTTPATFGAMDVGFGALGDVAKGAVKAARGPEVVERALPLPPLDIPEVNPKVAAKVRDVLDIRRPEVPPVEPGMGREWNRRIRARPALPDFSQRIQSRIGGRSTAAHRPIGEILEDVYSGLVSSTQRLKRADRALAGAGVPIENSVYAAGRATQGSARRAQGFMTFGPRRYVNGNWEATGTPGLEEVSRMAGQDVDAVSRYQLAARSLEVGKRDIKIGIDPVDATAEIATRPELDAPHKALVAFDRDMLHYWADAGGASPEGVAAMEALGQDYVHLGRVFEGAKEPGTRVGRVAQLLHPLRGNEELPIIDPWLSRVDRTARLVRAADRQRVALNLVELAEANPTEAAGLIRRVGERKGAVMTEEARRIQAAAAKAGHEIDDDVATQLSEAMSDRSLSKDNRISVWRNGRRETWELDPRMAKGLASLGPQEVSWFSRILGVGTGIFKGGVTLDPSFSLVNAFRDSFDASVQSQHGFRLGLDSFKGFYEAARANWLGKPRKVYEDFVASGGGFSTLRGAGTKGTKHVAEELTTGAASGRNIGAMTLLKNPIEALKRFALPFEEAARIGEFMRAKGAGLKDIEAFMRQQDVTVNFQEAGTVMRGLNLQVPFLNPAVQSLDRAVKTLGDPLLGIAKGRKGAAGEAARVYGTAVATITIPSILFWAASVNDQEVKDLRKTNAGLVYWFFRLPNGEIARLFKPFIYGQIFGTGAEAVLDKMFDEDPDAMGRWAEGVREQSVGTSLPMWAQIPSDIRANEASFFKTPIVPQGKEELEPRLQYGPQTSTLAKKFGELTGTSPAKGEYIFNQMTGTLGRRGLGLADLLTERATGAPTKPRELADNPLVGRFFARRATTAKEPVRTFYDALNELESLNRTFKADQADRPEQIEERYPPEVMQRLELLPSYREIARQLKDLRSQLDDVLASDMDVKVKHDYQKQIDDQIVELTRNANEMARAIR